MGIHGTPTILRAIAGTLSSMLESFAPSPGRFPACWNLSRRRRDAFQHAGILRVVAGTLSSMLESFAS